MTRTAEHENYLALLGLSDGSPPLKKSMGAKRGGTLYVQNKADLLGLWPNIFWRSHDDETMHGNTIVLKRGLATVGRIECASAALAWDAERICAGIRFKREK